MFRIYLNDNSFYDVKMDKASLTTFIMCTNEIKDNLFIVESLTGFVAINKSAIIKIIKL